jgi:hypothetical protein
MTWFFDHDASAETDRLLDALAGADVALVPQHWLLEVINMLLAAEGFRKKKAAESAEFFALLGKLAVEPDASQSSPPKGGRNSNRCRPRSSSRPAGTGGRPPFPFALYDYLWISIR